MKFIILLLFVASTRNEAMLIDKYVKVPERGYSLYSREMVINNKKYDYIMIEDLLPSLNEAMLMCNDSSVSKELNKLLIAYDNRFFDTSAFQRFYTDSIPYVEKIQSENLYYNKDTVYVAYKASTCFYSIDSEMSRQYLPIRYGYSAIKQKRILFPFLLVTNVDQVKSIPSKVVSKFLFKKYNNNYFMSNLEE